MTTPEYRQPFAGYEIALNGTSLTDRIASRFISLTLTEKRGGEADQLDLTLHDHDGRLAIPDEGAVLDVAFGWIRGIEPIGMVSKGRFKVDEAEHEGPPDRVRIRARSVDFTGSMTTRRERSWHETTLGAVVGQVATSAGLSSKIAPGLASIALPIVDQSRETDAALLRRLGDRHDAVATVKNGVLLFLPRGAGRSAAGEDLPALVLTRTDGVKHTWTRAGRDKRSSVVASWHDVAGGRRRTVTAGAASDGESPRRLRRTYATEADARTAANAELGRMGRAAATLRLDMDRGRPDVFPERPVTTRGFKPQIDAARWIVDEATHTLDGDGGLKTSLTLEVAGTRPDAS